MRFQGPVIIGAGPAGCAAAISLAKAGQESLLIDRDASVGDPLCGGFVSWKTAAQLSRLGVDCVSLGAHEVARLRLFSGKTSASCKLPQASHGLSRHALDTALRDEASRAGAKLVVDSIRHIEGRTAVGEREDWSGSGLFLANGKHDIRGASRPRQSADPALGLRLRLPSSSHLLRLIGGAIELHLFKGGYAGIVLQEDGSANICMAVRKSILARAGGRPHDLIDYLANKHPLFAQRLAGYSPGVQIDSIGAVPYGWIAKTGDAGIFKLGDQAAVIPSLAGEGMSIALASGISAARFWQHGGAATSQAYQASFAARANMPLKVARLARWAAESEIGHSAIMPIIRHLPGLMGLLMDRTRLPNPTSLARAPASP